MCFPLPDLKINKTAINLHDIEHLVDYRHDLKVTVVFILNSLNSKFQLSAQIVVN